jgi:hypothetical protein
MEKTVDFPAALIENPIRRPRRPGADEVGGEATVVRVPNPSLWTYLPIALLTLAILIGVPVAYRLWREAHEEDEEPASDAERLAQLEKAYYLGQMSKEEFLRVRESLARPKDAPPPGRGPVEPDRGPEPSSPPDEPGIPADPDGPT